MTKSKQRLTLEMKHDLLAVAWKQIWENDLPEGVQKPEITAYRTPKWGNRAKRKLSTKDWQPLWRQANLVIPAFANDAIREVERDLQENTCPKSELLVLNKYGYVGKTETFYIEDSPRLKKDNNIFEWKGLCFNLETPIVAPKCRLNKKRYTFFSYKQNTEYYPLCLKKDHPSYRKVKKIIIDILRHNLKINRKIRAKMGAYCELLEKTTYVADLIEIWPDAKKHIKIKINSTPTKKISTISQKSKDIILNDWAAKDEKLQDKANAKENYLAEIERLTQEVSNLKKQMEVNND